MRPIYNLVVSNVPGPPVPVYMAGARVVSLVPMGPVFDGAGLNITVLSYMDRVDVGFMACRETVPSLWSLAEAIPAAMEELLEAARDSSGVAASSTTEVDLTKDDEPDLGEADASASNAGQHSQER